MIAPTGYLFVSKRLGLEWFPACPLYSAPVVLVGGEAYYRLTPAVAVWLERAADALDRRLAAAPLPAAELAEAVAAFAAVWDYCRRHLDPAELRAARLRPPELPPVPHVPGPADCFSPTAMDGLFADLSPLTTGPKMPANSPPAAHPPPRRRPARRPRSTGGERHAEAAAGLFAR